MVTHHDALPRRTSIKLIDMAIFRLVGDVYSLSAVQYLFVSGAHGSERTPANDVARRHCSSFLDDFH